MSSRAYVLLETSQGKSGDAARILQTKRGVIKVDMLESSPDLIMIVEAASRKNLAKLTIKALDSVENITKITNLLPVHNQRTHAVRGASGS